ncbi:MAG: PIN domain-containing protein [Acidobacteriaceae bacterium]|nr:PIN domain-containing protein [Acidobacteriaceae bacterium]
MELISYLDTHVTVWLHAGETVKLSNQAAQQIEKSNLLISAMVMLEIEMLFEKGIVRYGSEQIYSDLHRAIGVNICQLPMDLIARSATTIKWTREPGDRLITANAIANNYAPLVTKDVRIREHYPQAIW